MTEALSWDERAALALAIVKQATEDHKVIPLEPLRNLVARALDRLQAAEQRLVRDQAQASKEGRRRIKIFLAALVRMTGAGRNLPPHLLNVIGPDTSHFSQAWQTIEVWKGICEEIINCRDRRDSRDDAALRKAAVDNAYQVMLDCKLPVQQPVRSNSVFCKLAAVLLGHPEQDMQRDCATSSQLTKPGIKLSR
jgi:hypothetical protein